MKWKGPAPILEVLTDGQWNDLKRLSGLPDKARVDVDGAISFYRKYRLHETDRPTSSQSREHLRALAKQASKLLMGIDELKETERLHSEFSAIFPGDETRRQKNADKSLLATEEPLRRFADQLDHASAGIKKGKRGPQTQTLDFVVRMLNIMLIELTGQPISRAQTKHGFGPADFAIKVLQIADGQLGRQTILNKIKHVVSEMEYWDDQYKPWLRL